MAQDDTDIFIQTERTKTCVDHGGGRETGVRVFVHAPGSVALQVRTYGPLNLAGTGKDREAFAQAELTFAEWEALIQSIQHVARTQEVELEI